ncbi:MAG TPA: transposase [Candidatus Limnocylindrales bacterium]|nr:transposase [Candidatus Limnocylindrales bacterium]
MSWVSGSTSWCSYTEDQIREIVRQAARGEALSQLAARYQVPEFVIRGWQSRYGSGAESGDGAGRGASSSEARLAQLEEENARLRRIVADMSLENRALKERLSSRD